MKNYLIKKIKQFLPIFLKINNLFFISIIFIYFISRILFIDVEVTFRIYYLFPVSLSLFLFEKSFKKYKNDRKNLSLKLINGLVIIFLIASPITINYSTLIYDGVNKIFLIFGIIFLYFFNFKIKKDFEIERDHEKFLLLSLVILFVIIKIPLLNKSFTGNNTIKYNTYVEPAKYMAESNNLFLVKIKYLADPIKNRDGFDKKLIGIPTLEWFLAITYKIFGLENIEVKTRLATSAIGLLILAASYKIIKKIKNKSTALIFLLLLITNPLFILITQLTTYDSVILLFFLISYLLFLKYEEKNEEKFLFYSSLVFSLSFLSKEVAIIWGLPFFSAYILFSNKTNIKKTITEIFLFSSVIAFSFLIFKIWANSLLYNKLISFIIFAIFSLIVYIISKKASKIFKNINIFSEYLVKKKYLLIILLTILFLLGIFLFKLEIKNWSEFITDKKIIFYWPMYEYIINARQILYISSLIFSTSLLGFFALFIDKSKNTKFKKFIFIFAFGLLVYLILASKVIFFHNYYNINFVYLYLLLSAYFLSIVARNLGLTTKIIFFAVFALLIYKSNREVWKELLITEKSGFTELTEFMIKNNEKDNFYIDNDNTLSISISTDLPRITTLNYPEIQADIKKIGFSETMKKYKIKYLVASQEIDYEKYAPVFTNLDLKKIDSTKRENLILEKFSGSKKEESSREIKGKALQIRNENIFDLETEIGDYKVYNLWND
ncbi:glycosyltransferase family 39 protein [Patescibacteria group bacterium]|nr:glycosyltransferase family 39 protein [Patescibacteria group bacterium]